MADPVAAKYKFAFTGTNCSGKTTMALGVAARLKKNAVLAEVVSSQDRKITWSDYFFPREPIAHYGMITNLIHAEVQASLKGDATAIITDRSVLDLYSIAVTDHPDAPLIKALEPMILAYMDTYDLVYYLDPLPYQEDGKRPADDFRMKTHATLQALMRKYQLPNIINIPREDVYKDILSCMGLLQPNPIFAEDTKWQTIANDIGCTLRVKLPACEVTSDIDVWVVASPDKIRSHVDHKTLYNRCKALAEAYFGRDDFHFMLTPSNSDFVNFPVETIEYAPR